MSETALSENQARLAPRLVEFNVHVARFAHCSWYDGARAWVSGGSLLDSCGEMDARRESHLSEWLLNELGLQDAMDWEMCEPQKRIWLLDGPDIRRLAQEIALAMHREWLLRLIEGTQLRALANSVDQGALHFVMEQVPKGQCHFRVPTVSFAIESSAEIGRRLEEVGARTLMALLQPEWCAVRGRAPLYFDRSQRLGDVPPFEARHREQALELLCGWLLPARFPQWAWCF